MFVVLDACKIIFVKLNNEEMFCPSMIHTF